MIYEDRLISQYGNIIRDESNVGAGETDDNMANIFIVGAPRSGTTILHQLLAFSTSIGYVDNLVARFHWNPSLGIKMKRDLNYKAVWSGNSNYGQTVDISEPHEFGKFWRDRLQYSNMVQKLQAPSFQELHEDLAAINREFKTPVLYKAFLLSWHLSVFHRSCSQKPKWIFITRDLADNAVSLLNLRRSRGNLQQWQSMVPIDALKYEKPVSQVVAQVSGINNWIRSELNAIESDNYINVEYSELLNDTESEIKRLSDFIGITPSAERLAQASVGVFRQKRKKTIQNEQELELIREAINNV